MNDYLDWPDVGQVFKLERVRVRGTTREVEVVCGITGLRRRQGDAQKLMGWVRGHWEVENRLYNLKDETLGEDRCRVRQGQGAQVLAALRYVAVHLPGQVTAKSKGATRRFAIRPREAPALLFTRVLPGDDPKTLPWRGPGTGCGGEAAGLYCTGDGPIQHRRGSCRWQTCRCSAR